MTDVGEKADDVVEEFKVKKYESRGKRAKT